MKKLLHSIISLLVIIALTIAPLSYQSVPLVRAEEATPASQTPPPAATEPPPAGTPAPAATQPPAATTAPAQAATPKPAATAKPPAGGTAYPTSSPTTQQAATPRPAKAALPSVADATAAPSSTPYATPAQGVTTGGQKDNSQTGDGSVKTGDANVNGTVINNANTNVSGGTAGGNGGTASSTNAGNGVASDNNATTNNTTSSDQALSNAANLTNDVEVGAMTGANSASRNTGDGEVVTGDANVGVTVINGANNNISGLAVNQYDVNGNQSGDIVLGQSQTTASCGGSSGTTCANGVLGAKSSNTGNGDSSNNNATTNNSSSSAATLSNDADVVNDVVIDAITGGNKADSNVGSGNIETGDANVALTVLNFLNNNIVAGTVEVVNIFGNYVGNIIIPESNSSGVAGNNAAGNNAAGNSVSKNTANGDSSTNNANTNTSNTNSTTQANLADIDNNLSVNANTGNNRTQSNTNGDNSVQTGSTNVDANVYNVANVNSNNGGYIVLVNDNGTWKGTIYGASGDKAASEGVEFVVQPDGTVVASNNANGTASDNNATANSTNSTSTTQTNNAQVQNNVKINADTGNNSASRNTDGGSIKTGNVNVAASIMNFVNNNFVGQTFRVVLVNVMGKWTGSVVPPGHKAPSPAQGGSQQASTQGAQTPKPSASATAQPASTAQPAQAAQTAGTATKSQGGKVLGKMTMNKQITENGLKNSAEIVMDDGQKYYVDDTLAVPQDKPIVAAAVGVKSATTNRLANYWIYSLGLIPIAAITTAVIIRKRKAAAL